MQIFYLIKLTFSPLRKLLNLSFARRIQKIPHRSRFSCFFFRFLISGREPLRKNGQRRPKGKISSICRRRSTFQNFLNCENSEFDLAKYLQKIVIIYFNVIITLNINEKYLILMKIGSVII